MPDAPEVVAIPNGSFAENTWLLIDPASRETVVVDPGEEHQRILDTADRHHGRITAIWLTHAHIDHVMGVDAVRGATGAPVWLHPADRTWYDGLPEQGAIFGIGGLERLAPPDHALSHGDRLALGPFRFDVRHVPGHAPGHVAFVGHGLCLSGDVIFREGVGRTDLMGGSWPTLRASIETEILTLPDETRILPGHGPETSVGHERRRNPFLTG